MKYRAMLASLLLIAAMPAAPAVAQSLTGTWIVSSEGRRGPQTSTLTLVQDGSALTGTITALTRAGHVMGTPRYMSPEQHLCTDVDARTDQFSFCIALWEALSRSRLRSLRFVPSSYCSKQASRLMFCIFFPVTEL